MKDSSKSILMIHEVSERIFELPLENYILTFDDGLYSQYYHWPKIQAIPTKKYFFISSNIVCKYETQNPNFITSVDAHKKAQQGIKELKRDDNVVIGGHGHSHRNLNDIERVTDQFKFVSEDTRNMMAWFSFFLDYVPTAFCFPYNNDLNGMYQGMISRYGFTEYYGKERISVESLF